MDPLFIASKKALNIYYIESIARNGAVEMTRKQVDLCNLKRANAKNIREYRIIFLFFVLY